MLYKKNGTLQEFNTDKLISSIKRAEERSGEKVDYLKIVESVKDIKSSDAIASKIIKLLHESGFSKTAFTYDSFRNYKKEFGIVLQDVYDKAKATIEFGDRENANIESTLVSAQQSLIRGYLTKELYRMHYLTDEERDASDDGYIYIHDMKDLIFNTINCCLFDIGTVLSGGFTMANVKYAEPSSIQSALQVIADVTLAASAQQFGGFTLAEIDKVLIPYYKKSLAKYTKDAIEFNIPDVTKYSKHMTERDLAQGLQALEIKLNTIPSSRGDFAFTTMTFGHLTGSDVEIQASICKAILNNRMLPDTPVVFPKLVYLYNQDLHNTCETSKELFELSIKCSCKALYPDYLSVDGPGYNGDIFRESGKIVSPMG